MHRKTADLSPTEVRRKKNIGEFLKNEIRRIPGIREEKGASLALEIRLKRIDPIEEAFESPRRIRRNCLSFCTLYILPSLWETEEMIRIRVISNGRVIETLEYKFHHLYYLSWLAIPFNLVVTPFSDSYWIDPGDIDYKRAWPELRRKLRNDLLTILCALPARNPSPAVL